MFNLDEAGYDIRAHVHDEVIATMPMGVGSVSEMCELMCKPAPWEEGLPLDAAGYECEFYQKDD